MFIGSGFNVTQQLNLNETQVLPMQEQPNHDLSLEDFAGNLGNTNSKFNNTQSHVLAQSQLINTATKQPMGSEKQQQPKGATA